MSDQVHDVYTGSDRFDVVVNHFGDARGIKDQFANSNPDAISSIISENSSAANLARTTVTGELQSIKAQLQSCWQGENADNAVGILQTLSTDAETIATNTQACGQALSAFQSKWYELRQRAMNLDTGVLGTGLGEDNAGAHQIYQEFNDAMNSGMHAMPSRLEYHTPLSGQVAGPAGPGPDVGGGGAPGGGPAIPTGMGSGAGFAPGGGTAGGMNLGQASTGTEHIGTATFGGGAGGYRSGPGDPAGLDPSALDPAASYSGNGSPPGSTGSPGPGAVADLGVGRAGAVGGTTYVPHGGVGVGGLAPGTDPATTLAGYHPGSVGGSGFGGAEVGTGGVGVAGIGPDGGLGAGIAGFAAPGLGAGGQEETRTSGIGSSASPAGAGALGSSETAVGATTGTAAGRTGMVMPMRGAAGDEDERERTTWLAEEDDVWSASDAPPGVIT